MADLQFFEGEAQASPLSGGEVHNEVHHNAVTSVIVPTCFLQSVKHRFQNITHNSALIISERGVLHEMLRFCPNPAEPWTLTSVRGG